MVIYEKKSSQHLISNAKINSWWIEDLKVSYQNHKNEESVGKELTNVDGEHLSKHKNKESFKLECNTNIVCENTIKRKKINMDKNFATNMTKD